MADGPTYGRGVLLLISIQGGVAGQQHAAPFLFLLRLQSICISRSLGARVLNIGATRYQGCYLLPQGHVLILVGKSRKSPGHQREAHPLTASTHPLGHGINRFRPFIALKIESQIGKPRSCQSGVSTLGIWHSSCFNLLP